MNEITFKHNNFKLFLINNIYNNVKINNFIVVNIEEWCEKMADLILELNENPYFPEYFYRHLCLRTSFIDILEKDCVLSSIVFTYSYYKLKKKLKYYREWKKIFVFPIESVIFKRNNKKQFCDIKKCYSLINTVIERNNVLFFAIYNNYKNKNLSKFYLNVCIFLRNSFLKEKIIIFGDSVDQFKNFLFVLKKINDRFT